MTTSSPAFKVAVKALKNDRLSPWGDVDLGGRVGEAVLAGELAADGRFQLRDAVDIGVLRFASPDRRDGGFFDIVRRVEVRLAGVEGDDIPPRRPQGPRLGRRRRRGGGLDAAERGGLSEHRRDSVGRMGRRRCLPAPARRSNPERGPGGRKHLEPIRWSKSR